MKVMTRCNNQSYTHCITLYGWIVESNFCDPDVNNVKICSLTPQNQGCHSEPQ